MDHKKMLYEAAMALLALFAVIAAVVDLFGKIPQEYYSCYLTADAIILLIFAVDYVCRFYSAEDKKQFFSQNVFDLIALIPLTPLLRALRFIRLFRMAKLLRLIRVAVFFRRFHQKASSFLRSNNFIYILYATLASILIGSVVMYILPQETAIRTYADALWWAFVTATTVGYGDISPVTLTGRLTAALLMIIGIGFISMLTGTIATFFLNKLDEDEKPVSEFADISELSEEDKKAVQSFIDFLKHQKQCRDK